MQAAAGQSAGRVARLDRLVGGQHKVGGWCYLTDPLATTDAQHVQVFPQIKQINSGLI